MSTLHESAKKNDLGTLNELLDRGANVDEKSRGATPLIQAAAYGALDAARLLIKKGATVDAKDSTGATALMYAATHGYDEIAKLLLDHGADINAQDSKGLTPVMHGAGGTYGGETLRFLLGYHPNLELRNKKGMTVLENMIEGRWPVQTAVLIQAGADVSAVQALHGTPRKAAATRKWIEQTAPLFYAAYTGDRTNLDQVFSRSPNPNLRDWFDHTPLMQAAEQGHAEVARLLLEHKAEVDAIIPPGGHCALTLAAQMGHSDVINVLAQYGADLNIRTSHGNSPITIAAEYDRLVAVQALLSLANAQGINLDVERARAIAQQQGHVDIAEFLKGAQ